jgi:hypothetical protein
MLAAMVRIETMNLRDEFGFCWRAPDLGEIPAGKAMSGIVR